MALGRSGISAMASIGLPYTPNSRAVHKARIRFLPMGQLFSPPTHFSLQEYIQCIRKMAIECGQIHRYRINHAMALHFSVA